MNAELFLQWPYQKHTNGDLDTTKMTAVDQSFHSSFKPAWASDGTIVYAVAGNAHALGSEGLLVDAKASIVSEGKDVRFAKFSAPADVGRVAARCSHHTDGIRP